MFNKTMKVFEFIINIVQIDWCFYEYDLKKLLKIYLENFGFNLFYFVKFS